MSVPPPPPPPARPSSRYGYQRDGNGGNVNGVVGMGVVGGISGISPSGMITRTTSEEQHARELRQLAYKQKKYADVNERISTWVNACDNSSDSSRSGLDAATVQNALSARREQQLQLKRALDEQIQQKQNLVRQSAAKDAQYSNDALNAQLATALGGAHTSAGTTHLSDGDDRRRKLYELRQDNLKLAEQRRQQKLNQVQQEAAQERDANWWWRSSQHGRKSATCLAHCLPHAHAKHSHSHVTQQQQQQQRRLQVNSVTQ